MTELEAFENLATYYNATITNSCFVRNEKMRATFQESFVVLGKLMPKPEEDKKEEPKEGSGG